MALSLSSQHPLVLRENTGQQGTQDTWPGPPTLWLCQPGQATYLITLGSSSGKRKSSYLSLWLLRKVNDKVCEPEEIFKRLANNHSTPWNTAQPSPSNFLLCALEAPSLVLPPPPPPPVWFKVLEPQHHSCWRNGEPGTYWGPNLIPFSFLSGIPGRKHYPEGPENCQPGLGCGALVS